MQDGSPRVPRLGIVVDEAHNLVERARGYGSPRLEARQAHEAEYWYGTVRQRQWIYGSKCNRLASLIEDSWVDPDLEKEGEWETDLRNVLLDLVREAENGASLCAPLGQRRSSEIYLDLLQVCIVMNVFEVCMKHLTVWLLRGRRQLGEAALSGPSVLRETDWTHFLVHAHVGYFRLLSTTRIPWASIPIGPNRRV